MRPRGGPLSVAVGDDLAGGLLFVAGLVVPPGAVQGVQSLGQGQPAGRLVVIDPRGRLHAVGQVAVEVGVQIPLQDLLLAVDLGDLLGRFDRFGKADARKDRVNFGADGRRRLEKRMDQWWKVGLSYPLAE